MLSHQNRIRRLGVLVLALVAACAGSSSESPWPVEPNEVRRGPAGEQPVEGLDMRTVPNRYPAEPDLYGGSGGGSSQKKTPEPLPNLEDNRAVP